MKMKSIRLFSIMAILVVLLSGLILNQSIGLAETGSQAPLSQAPLPTATPLPDLSTFINKGAAEFSFRELGQETIILEYPSVANVNANFPDYWEISSDASYMEFNYDFEVPMVSIPKASTVTRDGVGDNPSVEITVNDYAAGSFFPVVGKNNIVQIKFPARAVATITGFSSNPTKEISVGIGFYRDANYYCQYPGILTVLDTSKFVLNYIPVPPVRTLADFPRPLIQGSILPETLLFILPDQYNDSDLTAATTLASAIGAFDIGTLNFKVITASQVTDALLKASSAIIIGQPTTNSLVGKLYEKTLLPTSLTAGGTIVKDGVTISKESGVIQIIPSTGHNLYSFLVVTGSSDEGIVLAARELAKTRRGLTSNVYVFKPLAAPQIAAPAVSPQDIQVFNVTFSKLLFRTRVFRGLGTNEAYVQFYVPRDWDVQPGAKLIINYNFSSSLSMVTSTIAVNLNGIPLGSLPFDSDIVGDRSVEIAISPQDLIPGTINNIVFTSVQKPKLDCSPFDPTIYWITLRDNGILQIPYRKITNPEAVNPLYNPFFYLANEGNLLIIVPETPTALDLDGIITIASRLGTAVRSITPLNIVVTRGANVDPTTYKGYNYLVFGRPTQNPFIASVNEDLPQQFIIELDALKQQVANLEIHTPQDVDLGVIEAIDQKWDLFRGLTVISSTTPQGLKYLLDSTRNFFEYNGGDLFYFGQNNLVIPYLSSYSTGDLQAIIAAMENNPQQVITAVPTATSAFQSPSVVESPSSGNGINVNMSLLYGMIGAGFVVILYGVIQLLRRRVTKK